MAAGAEAQSQRIGVRGPVDHSGHRLNQWFIR